MKIQPVLPAPLIVEDPQPLHECGEHSTKKCNGIVNNIIFLKRKYSGVLKEVTVRH